MLGMKHRIAHGLGMVVTLALVLTACAPAATPTPVIVEKTKVVMVTPTPAPPKEMYTVKVIYWPGPESDAMQKVVDFFNEHRAEQAGFKVELVLFGRDQMLAKQEAIMAAGSDEVDTFFIASRWLAKYRQFLEPVGGYFADPEVNIWAATPKFFMQAALDGLTWFDGSLYAIPTDISCHFLYYRKDYVDELLNNAEWRAKYRQISKEQMGKEMEPKDPDQWTWDDYVAASYFFTQKYNPDSPTEYGNYTHGKVMGPTAFLWSNCFWGYGGSWFTEDGTPNFDTDAARKAQEIWTLFWEKGLTPPSSIVGEYPECNEALMTGQCALAVHWNAAFHTLDAEDSPVHGKFGVVAPPAGPEGRFCYNHTLAMALSKFSSHKKEAARWLAYCCTEEAVKLYAESGGIPPAATVLNAMGDVRPDFPAMSRAVDMYGRSLNPYAGFYEDILCENLANAWAGNVSIEESLKQAQADCLAEKEKRGL